jgi:hypothetical protein
MAFDFHVHGLWILGSITLMFASLIAGNVEWVEGTTPVSFILALLMSLALFLLSGLLWISAAINARH